MPDLSFIANNRQTASDINLFITSWMKTLCDFDANCFTSNIMAHKLRLYIA